MNTGPFSDRTGGLSRRNLLLAAGAAATLANYHSIAGAATTAGTFTIDEVRQDEDVFAYIERVKGSFDQTTYQQVIGAANEFKEGDQAIGVGADNEATRSNARALLANTKIGDLYRRPLFHDDLQQLIWQSTDQAQYAQAQVKDWTMGQLKEFLLAEPRGQDQGDHERPDQRHDRLRPETDERRGARLDKWEDLQRDARHQVGGEGVYGRANPAQFSNGPPRR